MSDDVDSIETDVYDDVANVQLAPCRTLATTSKSTRSSFSGNHQLADVPPLQSQIASVESSSIVFTHQSMSLPDQVVYLEEKVLSLSHENATLKRNMGTLFRTASAELTRKNRQLHALAKEQR